MSIDLSVQGVFDKAMYLIDAQNENSGSTDNSDTTEYKVRTLGILNIRNFPTKTRSRPYSAPMNTRMPRARWL